MKCTWEYFSLHYLNMWLRHDKIYHELLNEGAHQDKLASVKRAAAYYKVARNIPSEYDEGGGHARYEPIVKILDKVVAEDFSENAVRSIGKVERKISKAYGDRSVLSITTKLLWLKIRSPIIIYDSQARKALKTEVGNFPEFYEAWKNEYIKCSKEIVAVCSKLSRISKYSCDQNIATPGYVSEISAQPWFQERVFDVYLWQKGK